MGIPSDSLGQSSGQVGGSSSVTPAVSSSSSATSAKKTGYSSKDTLSASDLEASLQMMWTINAEMPILALPSTNPSSNSNSMAIGSLKGIDILSLSDQYSKICRNILDGWAKNIKEQVEQAKEIEKSPAHQAKLEFERDNKLQLVNNIKNYADQLQLEQNVGTLGSITSALIITGAFTGFIAQGVVDVSSTSKIGVTPQIDFAANFATQALTPIADDFRAQLGLIGAWAMGTLINFSSNEAVADKQSPKPVDEKALADKYAAKVLGLISGNQLNNFVMALLVNKTEKGEPLSNERKTQLTAVVKMVILASALAAVYKSKTGKITGQEFLDLASGKMKAEAGNESQLVKAIQQQLDTMLPSEKFNLLNALATYMDKDPKLNSFFDLSKTLDSVNETLLGGVDTLKT